MSVSYYCTQCKRDVPPIGTAYGCQACGADALDVKPKRLIGWSDDETQPIPLATLDALRVLSQL